MSQEVYAIVDLDGYATQLREAAAKSLSEDSEDNLDEFITLTQIINMVKNNCVGFDDNDRPLLDEATNEKIFEDTAVWIHNVGLAKLAAKDLVECAWDDNDNEMVFWVKEKKKESNNESKRKQSRRKNLGDQK